MKRYLNDVDASEYLGMSLRGFRGFRARGLLPAAPLIGARRVNDREKLDAWIAEKAGEEEAKLAA